jgi:hypothetical protein
MGSQFVDGSQGWGGIGNSIAGAITGAPGVALSNIHAAEVIKDQRIKRAQEEEKWNLGTRLVEGVDAATPAAYVAPRPYTAADISNPAVLDAPLSVTDRVSGSFGGGDVPNGMFTDPRALALAEAQRAQAVAGQQATVRAHPEQWAPQMAYGSVATAGVPDSATERARLEFLAGKGFPTHIGVDESKQPVKQWVPINDQNETIGQAIASRVDPSRPGQRYALSSPISPAAPNPFENEGVARQKLAVIDQEVAKNGGMTDEQARLVPQLIDSVYKPKRVREGTGDAARIRIVREVPMSPQHKSLYELATAPTTSPAPGSPPAVPVDPNADVEVSKEPISAAELRKEYDLLPEVKRMVTTTALYNDVAKSATLPTNRVRDLDLVYSFIRTMDDLTGVRDAEVKMVGQTGSWDEIKNELLGRARGEGMDNRTRLNILETLRNRIDQYAEAKAVRDAQFRDIATKGGLAHRTVVPDMPALVTIDPDKVLNAPRGASVAPEGGGIFSGIFGTQDRRAVPPVVPAPTIPPENRVVNQVYPTPNGPMKWTGTGWINP